MLRGLPGNAFDQTASFQIQLDSCAIPRDAALKASIEMRFERWSQFFEGDYPTGGDDIQHGRFDESIFAAVDASRLLARIGVQRKDFICQVNLQYEWQAL